MNGRCLINALILAALSAVAGCSGEDGDGQPLSYEYVTPLDPRSPWPKFRRNEVQNGRSPIRPVDSGRLPWAFPTGKGIFSTPVIDGDGTVYVGSADHYFYAIDRDGRARWSFLTGEVIDSSALLDDAERVIVGSGDGHLYALDRRRGQTLWTFRADDPAVNVAFINWFEGNVAIGPDGTLYAPNDNFCTYAIERASGERIWCFKTLDQTWSSPALNPVTGRLFMGNNFYFLDNTLAIDARTGAALWKATAQGSVAASPLLASIEELDLAIVGSFDGFLRAYEQESGAERWRLGLRDHIYASPAQLEDGTIIQPGADGTVYAVRPEDGAVLWAFDTIEPIRSSPAIDGDGNIYVGSGEGRLFVLNPDGTLRWSMRLIDDARDDLNASPALGRDAVVIAGENGTVHSVPYDYCLRAEAADDSRCRVSMGEDLPPDGVFLLYTTSFGRLLLMPPATIEANQPLTFSLLVRAAGDTRLALIDSDSLEVTFDPQAAAIIDVSGDRKFISVVPRDPYRGPDGGPLSIRMRGTYLVNFDREGLRFTGGEVGGQFDQTFDFEVVPRSDGGLPLPVPRAPGDPSGIWDLYRIAVPLPTILPSYNQIGFDSIHYLIGLVEGDDQRAIAWGVGGRLASGSDQTEVDPGSRVRFPVEVRYDGGLLTMVNEDGFVVEFNGFPIPFDFFRAATRIDAEGAALTSPALNVKALCGGIDFYGPFLQLLGYCNPTTDLLDAVGAAELRPHRGGVQGPPEGVGTVTFTSTGDAITAAVDGSTLRLDQHNVGILLINAGDGRPLALNYTSSTTSAATPAGVLASVSLALPASVTGVTVRAYLMIDSYPARVDIVTL